MGVSCAQAHSASTGTSALSKTAISTGQVLTQESMTATATLRVCYAVSASLGNSAEDFVTLGSTFSQLARVDYAPKRTIQGAAQVITVSGGAVGDLVAWKH